MKPEKCEETLPEDMMEEILSRVPVKSLLKFRCVSKSWCHLIDSKRFVKTHLQNSIKSTSVAHHETILKKRKGLRQYSLPSFTDSISCEEINVDGGTIRVVGCCNGLVCFLVDGCRSFVLWNPATRKSRKLPDFGNKIMIRKYGFGLDEVSNDYKVFGIPWSNNNIIGYSKVYSLRSNSWKVVEERDIHSESSFHAGGMGVYASGKLHWYVHYKREIASFDLNSHVYRVVELPTYSDVMSYRLGVHNGCLILLCSHRQQTGPALDIWVIKENGSWDKLGTIPYSNSNSNSNPNIPYFDYLLAIAPHGEVLLLNTSSILKIYNLKYNLFQYPKIISDVRILESGIYIESLASVDPDVES